MREQDLMVEQATDGGDSVRPATRSQGLGDSTDGSSRIVRNFRELKGLGVPVNENLSTTEERESQRQDNDVENDGDQPEKAPDQADVVAKAINAFALVDQLGEDAGNVS